MEKLHKMIKTLFKNQENLAAKLYDFEKRIGVILNSQLTCNESITKISADIEVLSKLKNENVNAIEALNEKIGKIDSELADAKIRVSEKETIESSLETCVEASRKKCSFCQTSFEHAFELENHLEETHGEKNKFQCDKCNNTFQLEWRLKKHKRMHIMKNVKCCKYFITNENCPFEKIGCKFLHEAHSGNIMIQQETRE